MNFEMKVHFIAIGGSAMHNLALALHDKGYRVTGSDDEIFEPSRSRLEKAGLLPSETGWYPEKITPDLDAVILGMHAREDNPELQRALQLGLEIYSYPEFIYRQSEGKLRVVIAGSHGKTTITSMVLHVLNYFDRDVDYMVGAQLEGFDKMVKLTREAQVIVLEGDEYLSSPIDRTPKFMWYKPQLALLSGIAWDHINVFPTFENYVEQFDRFVETVQGTLVYNNLDNEVRKVVERAPERLHTIPYGTPAHVIEQGVTYLTPGDSERIPLQVFGLHNLQNLNGARIILNELNITDSMFYEAVQSFKGASKRLEKIAENDRAVVYKDFAHSPSKLQATATAVKTQWPARKLVAVLELHTFSSLNPEFLKEYAHTFDVPDEAVVFYRPETLAHKNLPPISQQDVMDAFKRPDLKVITSKTDLLDFLGNKQWDNCNLLLMSSGNFGGVDVDSVAQALLKTP